MVALLSEDIYLALKRLINLLAMAANMKRVFPEALSPLLDCDPEVASIIKDEKARQWWVSSTDPDTSRPRSAATCHSIGVCIERSCIRDMLS